MKITKMTLKRVLSEKHPLWPASHPLYARNRVRFSRFLQTLRVGALHRVLLLLAAPRRNRVAFGRYWQQSLQVHTPIRSKKHSDVFHHCHYHRIQSTGNHLLIRYDHVLMQIKKNSIINVNKMQINLFV